MVRECLKASVEKSSWKPSEKEYDVFAGACHGQPILAAICLQDVCYLVDHGSTLKVEFLLLSDIKTAPKDLGAEYLRILRRAFMSGAVEPSHRFFRDYQQVVGTIVAA